MSTDPNTFTRMFERRVFDYLGFGDGMPDTYEQIAKYLVQTQKPCKSIGFVDYISTDKNVVVKNIMQQSPSEIGRRMRKVYIDSLLTDPSLILFSRTNSPNGKKLQRMVLYHFVFQTKTVFDVMGVGNTLKPDFMRVLLPSIAKILGDIRPNNPTENYIDVTINTEALERDMSVKGPDLEQMTDYIIKSDTQDMTGSGDDVCTALLCCCLIRECLKK
jgi:hypothetical protein